MSSGIRKVKRSPNGDEDATRLAHQALQFVRMAGKWAGSVGAENHIRSISLYPPSQSRNGQWLVIGKAWSGGYKLVAFHRSSDPLTALLGFLQRASEEKLDWKEDTFVDGKPHLSKSLGGGHD